MHTSRLNKIILHRHTLWDMAMAQLKAKYAGSRLGIWWAVFTPLILALSINFVFTMVFKIDFPGYTLFVLSGILPWFFFNTALAEATNSFVSSAPILKQGVFPREFIPVASVLGNLFNFLIGLAFFLPLFMLFNPRMALLLPLLLLTIGLEFIFAAGLGILFSCWNVFFRDTGHFLASVFMVWFWVTPVFYSLAMLPAHLKWVCLANPVTYFVVLYQEILFGARTPPAGYFLIAFGLALFSLACGYAVFMKKEAALLKKI